MSDISRQYSPSPARPTVAGDSNDKADETPTPANTDPPPIIPYGTTKHYINEIHASDYIGYHLLGSCSCIVGMVWLYKMVGSLDRWGPGLNR